MRRLTALSLKGPDRKVVDSKATVIARLKCYSLNSCAGGRQLGVPLGYPNWLGRLCILGDLSTTLGFLSTSQALPGKQ